ncbi:MAG: cytochrome c oxidase subunit I [Rhodanobacter sp.]
MSYAATTDQHDEHHGAPKNFFQRWCMSTNHKDIGSLYLIFALTMLFVGGSFAMLIRAELFKPGMQLMQPYFFNELTSMHGLIMIFGAIMPAFVGLGNWMIPLMIGAPDMALPRMNNLSFWILPFAFILLLSSMFLPGGGPAGGWTMYPPLSLQSESLPYAVFAIHLMGISSIMGAINIIATILNMRAPGMDLMKMPIFVWSWLITAFLLIAVMPVLAGAVTMLLTDKYFGTNFFNPGGGGDPILYQHIFWFFGHPEVYIMILPAFGIVSEIIPTFARKPIFGYKAMVFSIACIAFLSFIVWAHHMFAVGLPIGADMFFMYATMLIAVPTGVKVFNWVATMWGSSMTFETPMLFAIAFVVLFSIGGFSGLMMALVPADFQYHDTYFIVAHFHYVLVTGALFAILGAAYLWMPKWTGHMYSEFWGKVHFWNSLIWVNVLFFPQHFLGLAGMPRRIPDYNVAFANFNMISSIGGFLFGATQLIFLGVLIHCVFFSRKKATDRVWEGAKGLEWTVPSPAPFHTFTIPPLVVGNELAHGHMGD